MTRPTPGRLIIMPHNISAPSARQTPVLALPGLRLRAHAKTPEFARVARTYTARYVRAAGLHSSLAWEVSLRSKESREVSRCALRAGPPCSFIGGVPRGVCMAGLRFAHPDCRSSVGALGFTPRGALLGRGSASTRGASAGARWARLRVAQSCPAQ